MTLLRDVVRLAIAELRAAGQADDAILQDISRAVENAVFADGRQKKSLLSGQPAWLEVQAEILKCARLELTASTDLDDGS